jgi:hypothetical protein
LDGLYLSAFEPSKIKANPTVRQFYETIQEIEYKDEVKTPETSNVFEETLKNLEYKDPTIKTIKI